MLVIVQNPGMSDLAFDDDGFVKEPKKPEGGGVFNISPTTFQQTTCPSSLPPDSSTPLIDHEAGLQRFRLRSSGDLSTSAESRSRTRENPFPGAVKEGSRSVDGKEDKNAALVFVDEVVVDVKALKDYSCLQFENDSRTLHLRSNSSMGFVPHQSSIV